MSDFRLMAVSFGLEMEKLSKKNDEPFYKRHKGKLLAGAGLAAAVGTGAYLHHKGHLTFKHIPKNAPKSAPKPPSRSLAEVADKTAPKAPPIRPASKPRPPKKPSFKVSEPGYETAEDLYGTDGIPWKDLPEPRRILPHVRKLEAPKPHKPRKPFMPSWKKENLRPFSHAEPKAPLKPRRSLSGRLKYEDIDAGIDKAFGADGPKRTALQRRLFAKKPEGPTVIIRKKGKAKKASSFLHTVLADLFET